MIGHWLLQCTAMNEDNVLTGRLAPGSYHYPDGSGCLVGVAASFSYAGPLCWYPNSETTFRSIEDRYDELCVRFGEQRVNAAIRNRILANRARRTLQAASLAAV